jgi:hypothetical protein
VALLLHHVSIGAEPVKRAFNLPAADAVVSLKLFSEQAGQEILYPYDRVKGIRTNAVSGEYTALEALRHLLAGTTLVVNQARNGALGVNRSNGSPPTTPTAPAKKKSDSLSPQEAPSTMNTSANRPWLARIFGALLAASTATAQSTDSRGRPSSTLAEKDPVALSPFVVTSDKDTGYQATSTLAGTRLNTPIKDLAASISIYTKDFLDDVGATNSNQLLIYATGMEASGPGGNFSAMGNDLGADRPSGDPARVEPQGEGSRTRGLAAPTFTRNYFPTAISFDSYNTSTVTVNRGPNAALFGVGSAAGVVNTALISADLNRNSNKVVFRYGNNDSIRSTADFNRVLIPGKLAARIALLRDNEKYNQRPAFENKKRAYGTMTFQPFRSTLIRANFETGSTVANRPITFLPANDISAQWLAAGRPGYDWTLYDDPGKNPNASSIIAGPVTEGSLIGSVSLSGQVIAYNNPWDKAPSNGFSAQNRTTTTYAANAIASQIFHPVVNRDSATDTIRFITTRNVFYLPASYWTGGNLPPGQQPGFIPVGMKMQSFSDYDVFDWRSRQIDESSRQGNSFHASNIALSQTGWKDRVGIELAYDRQRFDRRAKNSFFDYSNSRVLVDVNAVMPNGQPNPNYGRPFSLATTLFWQDFFQEKESQRATSFLKYNFVDVNPTLGKWLGRHTLTGLYEKAGSTTVSYARRLHTAGAASEAADAGNIFSSNRRPSFVVYMGPSLIGNNNPVRLDPIQVPELVAGPTTAISDFVRAANQSDPGRFESSAASLVDIVAGGAAEREVIKSQAAVLQSHWLDSHLITLLSWRKDEAYFARRGIGFVANPNDRNDPGKAVFGLEDFSFPRTPPRNLGKEIVSFGVVLAWPHRLIRLPRGTDLNVFYNKSENFTPIGGRVNQFAEPLSPPEGVTKEYGLNLQTSDGKFNVRINRFETAVQGVSAAPAFFSGLRAAILNVGISWAREGNTNPHLAAQSNADLELLFSPLPANYKQLYNFVVSGSPPNVAANANVVALPSTDSVDTSAKGLEMDVTYNPTKNWRILLNVAKQETIQTNQYPFSKRFISLMKPVWDRLASRPANNYPTGYVVGNPLPPTVETYGQYLDRTIYVPLASAIATEGSVSAEQRKWRANLVTNYKFSRDSFFGEKLRGWSVGAALRWQDKMAIGYPSSRSADGAAHFDLSRPFYVSPETNVDGWISYERPIWSGRVTWKAQLNINNMIGRSDLIPVVAQSWDGTVAQYRLPPERRWYLTNSFSF